MPVHAIANHTEDTAFVDGLPVGFSSFDPDSESGSGSAVDLLDPPAGTQTESWSPLGEPARPLASEDDDDDYADDDDDDDDDIWDDDDEDEDDDDFDDDDEDEDDDLDDPFTLDDDEDDDF